VTIVGSRRQTRKIDMIKLTDDELMAFARLIAKSRPGAVALTTGRAGVILEALGVANTTPQRPFNLAHYLLATRCHERPSCRFFCASRRR
jgi:hypothetical protein